MYVYREGGPFWTLTIEKYWFLANITKFFVLSQTNLFNSLLRFMFDLFLNLLNFDMLHLESLEFIYLYLSLIRILEINKFQTSRLNR